MWEWVECTKICGSPQSGVVMTINSRECFECHEGVMEKPVPLHSYDFDVDGKPIFSCSECGYGYREYTPISKKYVTKISNHSLKDILTEICNSGKDLGYEFKKILYHQLKDNDLDVYPLARQITNRTNRYGFRLDFYSVLNIIYKNQSFSS